MPIRFICEFCDTRMKMPEGSEGRLVKCPRCGQTNTVPGESLQQAALRDFQHAAAASSADSAISEKTQATATPPSPSDVLATTAHATEAQQSAASAIDALRLAKAARPMEVRKGISLSASASAYTDDVATESMESNATQDQLEPTAADLPTGPAVDASDNNNPAEPTPFQPDSQPQVPFEESLGYGAPPSQVSDSYTSLLIGAWMLRICGILVLAPIYLFHSRGTQVGTTANEILITAISAVIAVTIFWAGASALDALRDIARNSQARQ